MGKSSGPLLQSMYSHKSQKEPNPAAADIAEQSKKVPNPMH